MAHQLPGRDHNPGCALGAQSPPHAGRALADPPAQAEAQRQAAAPGKQGQKPSFSALTAARTLTVPAPGHHRSIPEQGLESSVAIVATA